ncbi:methyltransferase [Marinimicrobium sp. ARAG 43.8]|uniref:methyltransferase n=1 Tax=Marinimicrobium sp. ARAG 43.8 TaxID=3418719 RepID=UPI003CEF5564
MSEANDATFHWLLEQMRQADVEHNAIWFLDENAPDHWALPARASLTVASNRWDQAEAARAKGFTTHFTDFEETLWQSATFDCVYYRIAKEKPVTHHIINLAGRLLKPGGQLVLCGQKNEGAKTVIDNAGKALGDHQRASKSGNVYSASITRAETPPKALNDSDYAHPRVIGNYDGLEFHSKPGLFGWQKIDRGSQLLWQSVKPSLNVQPPRQLLDLGCGYGFLGLLTGQLPIERRVLTDNNAAALAMAQHNAQRHGINAEIIAADCADRITETFDVVLCNPPFHQGFSVRGDLTDRFLASAREHLKRNGTAYFVVNRFIPLPQTAKRYFSHCQKLGDEDGFTVFALTP